MIEQGMLVELSIIIAGNFLNQGFQIIKLIHNYEKYLYNGTSLNLNKGKSGRKRTGRSRQAIAAVRNAVAV